MFLILSYRSNELDEFHTFNGLIKRKGERWNKIQLENIEDGYVLDFLVDTLQEESYDIEKLAKIIAKKSDRNPFYVRQFTENILRKNLIKPSENQDKKLDIELDNINKLNNSDSLLTILLSKIDLLPDSCIEILNFSSLITGKIGLFFISELLKKDPNKLLEMIQDAVDLELVILNSNQSETFFTFSHDKILEAFQTGIEPEKKSGMHKSIGDLYYRYYLINRDARMLFYSVDHFNLSNLDSFEVYFLEELVKLNLQSAIESKYIGAYNSAEFYISKSMELQKIPGIVLDKEISDDILINNVEILYLNSRLDEALEFSNSIDKDALTDRQYIILGTIITRIYSKKNNLELSVNNTLTVFKKFGIHIPRNKILLIGKMLFRLFLIKLKVSSLKIDGILNYKVFEDEKYNLLFDLQADTGASTFSYDQNIFVLSVLESLKITFKFGLMKLLKHSYKKIKGYYKDFPEGFAGKKFLMDAEIYRLRGNLKKVWNAYENAIQSSTSQGLIHEVGNAHWVYSRFLDSIGHRISSYAHIKEAIKSFKAWEAYRIVSILEEKQDTDSFHSSDLTVTKNRTISDRILDLDYQSVLKSVKILSSEKNEVSLVSRLLDLILENTGGDYASYILSDGTEKASKSLKGKNNDYPRTIFRYVLNSKKPLLIGNLKEESRFAMDEYFDSHRASSILCYPI